MSATPEGPGEARVLADAAEHASSSAVALAGQLAALRQELAEERKQRREELAAERKRGRRNSLGLIFMSLGLVLDVALTGAIAGLAWGQVRANDRIEQSLRTNYTTAQQQTQTRVHVLCPLYEVLLAAAANPSPESQSSPAAKARFNQAVKTIRDGYTTLGCTPPLPTATPSGVSSSH